MPVISPARKAAFGILLAVERGKAHSDDLLRAKEVDALTSADRNLATALVLGVLRCQIFLDQQIRPLLKRPNAKLDPEVLIALRIGVYQLRFLDRVPAHAAIDESVELTKKSGHRFAAGMVNAILRSIARSADSLENSSKSLHYAVAHPAWLVERWTESYGDEAMQAICSHGQGQPRVAVRLQSHAVEEDLNSAGIEFVPGELISSARVVISGDVASTTAFREGRVRIQDEGSQLIGELASCTGLAQSRQRILDACAAPGGKTLILTERNPEAQIVACESSPKRFADLRRRLDPHANRVECRLADAAELMEDSVFDLALVDVPCSGTGTLGRNPEIRHRLRPEDLPRLAESQRAILRAAVRAVHPGGSVVYATCSIEQEENEQVVSSVLAENSSARQISFEKGIEALKQKGILQPEGAARLQQSLTPEGALRLLPGALRTDGFYVALIQKQT